MFRLLVVDRLVAVGNYGISIGIGIGRCPERDRARPPAYCRPDATGGRTRDDRTVRGMSGS
jgi:hypothetical protein